LEGWVWERERLVADDGRKEGKGKGRRRVDIWSGRRRMEKRKREWKRRAEIG